MHCVLWVRWVWQDHRCYVLCVKWVWWDYSRCYVLCDLSQVSMVRWQQVLCVVWFESGGCEGITAGDKIDVLCDLNQVGVMGSQQVQCLMWFESSGFHGITAGTVCCVIWVKWMWWGHSWCYVLYDSSRVDVMGSEWVLFCVFQMVWLWCCTRWCRHSTWWRTLPLTRLFWASSSSCLLYTSDAADER